MAAFERGLPGRGHPEFRCQEHCSGTFTRAAQQVTGHLVTVEFERLKQGDLAQPMSKSPRAQGPKLHADYTFENFVVGAQ